MTLINAKSLGAFLPRCAFVGLFLCNGAACDSAALDSGTTADARTSALADASVSDADATMKATADAQVPVASFCDNGYQAGAQVFALGPQHPTEISGLLISRKNPGVLWVHDDGGNPAKIYALNMSGTILGSLELATPAAYPPHPANSGDFQFNNDWEDSAIGPCGDDECLYIADFGDNSANKQDGNANFHYTIYKIVEPDVDANTPFAAITSNEWSGHAFRYPDGSHNAEALAVSSSGVLYIFTKEESGARSDVFRFAPLEEIADREFTTAPQVLSFEGSLEMPIGPLGQVTGASMHRNGERVALRTYQDLFEYQIGSDNSWGNATRDVTTPQLSYPNESPQGEAVAYHPTTGHLFTISENPSQGLLLTASLHEFSCQ